MTSKSYFFLTFLLALGTGSLRSERSIYLNTLDLTPFVAGFAKTTANQTFEKKPLQVGTQTFSQGIWSHAPCTTRLALPSDALFLCATVGVQLQAGKGGTVRFLIKDEENAILFDSGVMNADTPARDLEIPLNGRKYVTLVTDPGSDGNNGDHAVWGQARLIVSGRGLPAPAFVRNDVISPDISSLQMPVEAPVDGLLIGNGRLGASIWGEVRVLRFSLDLAGLWTRQPGPPCPPLIGLNPEAALQALPQTGPGSGPRRLPLGRLELTPKFSNNYANISVNHGTGVALANFAASTASVSALIHAEEPVLLINCGLNEFGAQLLPPAAAARLGLPEPQKGEEVLPSGTFSWFALQNGPETTFTGSLLRPKTGAEPWLVLVTAESAPDLKTAREAVLARLLRIAGTEWKTTLKAHADWWKVYNDQVRLLPGPMVWKSRTRLAQYVLGSSARAGMEPGGWLWTFEEADPDRLPAALSTGYPACAPLFASYRLGFAETATALSEWHLARREIYGQHARAVFGATGLLAPGLLLPNGAPAALAPECLDPALAAQAGWPFLLRARLDPTAPFVSEKALPWLEDTARALSQLAGGENSPAPKLPWGSSPGRAPDSPPSAATTWQDSLLLRHSFGALGDVANSLNNNALGAKWSALSARVPLPSSFAEKTPGQPWPGPGERPGQLLALHPLNLVALPSLPLENPPGPVPLSTRLWLACAASRGQPAEAARTALVPVGRNGLPLALERDPGGIQGLLAQTLEFVENQFLVETPEGAALVFPNLPPDWSSSSSFKNLTLGRGVRFSGDWAGGALRQVEVTASRDGEVSLVDVFGAKGFKTSHKGYRRAGGKIILSLKGGETAVLKAP